MSTRFIIIAAGNGSRWDNHLGIPKHYAMIDGEPIIERTVRLLKERGAQDIWVVSTKYDMPDARPYYPTLNPDNEDADKFISSQDIWSKNRRTVVIYGDVYFTENAIDIILNEPCPYYRLFCRPTHSEKFGYPYGECFAVSFYSLDHGSLKYNLQRLVHLFKADVIDRIGGWELTRLMAGVPIHEMNDHKNFLENYIIIDDETNDVDYPSDYELLKKAVEQ